MTDRNTGLEPVSDLLTEIRDILTELRPKRFEVRLDPVVDGASIARLVEHKLRLGGRSDEQDLLTAVDSERDKRGFGSTDDAFDDQEDLRPGGGVDVVRFAVDNEHSHVGAPFIDPVGGVDGVGAPNPTHGFPHEGGAQ